VVPIVVVVVVPCSLRVTSLTFSYNPVSLEISKFISSKFTVKERHLERKQYNDGHYREKKCNSKNLDSIESKLTLARNELDLRRCTMIYIIENRRIEIYRERNIITDKKRTHGNRSKGKVRSVQ